MKPARSVPVLMYHHVSPSPGMITLTPQHFAEQIRGLAAAGYRSLSAAEFAAYLAGEPTPDKSVLITFDDGYLDNWVYAHPVLREFGMKAVMFIVTDWVKDGPLRPHAGDASAALPPTPSHHDCEAAATSGRAADVIVHWSEVEAMAAAGTFEFHSHTHTHTRWDKISADPAAKREGLSADLALSRATLVRRLGAVSDHLCWPQGFFDDDYVEIATAAGFRHLHTVRPGPNRPGDDPRHIRRVVTKDKSARWLNSRLWLYRQPKLADWYARGR